MLFSITESVVVVDREEYEQPTPAASPSTMKRQIEAGNHASPQSQRPAIKLSELPQYIQNRKQKTDGFKDEYKVRVKQLTFLGTVARWRDSFVRGGCAWMQTCIWYFP